MNKKEFKITDKEIKRLYLEGNSLADIAKIAQDTKGYMALRRRLQDLGVSTTKDMKRYRYKLSGSGKKYSLDSDVFLCIDSPEKAYWLGFIMADGYNHETKSCVSVRIQQEDSDLLKKLKTFLKTNAPIYEINRSTIKGKLGKYSELNICSPKFSENLAKLGCIQGKTYLLEFPNIEEKYYSHFIRGYFDGDGCISIVPRRDRVNCKQYQLNFVGKESVILKIQEIICNSTGVSRTKLRNKETSFAKAISWSGRLVCKRILDYLYTDATIYLERKYNKYLQLGNPAE